MKSTNKNIKTVKKKNKKIVEKSNGFYKLKEMFPDQLEWISSLAKSKSIMKNIKFFLMYFIYFFRPYLLSYQQTDLLLLLFIGLSINKPIDSLFYSPITSKHAKS